jgi:two-component system, OmpR family, KDP operon response regulator KdpE
MVPARADELRAKISALMQSMSRREGNALKGIRILLVEDDAHSRAALTALLAADGAEVVGAECGRTALTQGDSIFDVVLTDLGLPDIPGDVLLRTLLARAPVRPLVIVMTGYGEPHLTRARQSGADVVLLKPLDWTALRAHVRPAQRPAA